MNDLTHVVGLLRREFRDTHAVVSNIDLRTRRMVGPQSVARPAGLVARLAACAVLSRVEKRGIDAVARQHFANDTDLASLITLRTATGPAVTTVPAWAGELVTDVVADIAQNLLPASVFAQLRARGLSYAFVPGRGLVRVPMHTPTPSGAFVGESGAIPLAALILGSSTLKPKKAACIVTATRELMSGTPANVEQTLRVLLGDDLGLMVDAVLLSNAAATASAPAGLFAGVTPLMPMTGGGINSLIGDVKNLLTAIAPAVRPVLVMNTMRAATVSIYAPALAVPVIVAPAMATDSIAAIDAASFASAMGVPEFMTDEDAAVHEETVPLPLSATGTPNVSAAPTRSLWQTASIGIRTLLDVDWSLRRSNAVALINGVLW
jgi:hypothetical protein